MIVFVTVLSEPLGTRRANAYRCDFSSVHALFALKISSLIIVGESSVSVMTNNRGISPLEYDRVRGILNKHARQFLAGELDEELMHNQIRQKRYRLRQRVFHALQDLVYL